MKVTIEINNLSDLRAVMDALEGRVTVSSPAPEQTVTLQEPKAETAKRGRKPKVEAPTVEAAVAPVVEAAAVEAQSEPKNEPVETGAEAVSTVEEQEGDIDDAKMREIGGKLLRDMNAKGKDGVGELTKILSSLGSKKVTEVPMNLRPRFVAKVNEALA